MPLVAAAAVICGMGRRTHPAQAAAAAAEAAIMFQSLTAARLHPPLSPPAVHPRSASCRSLARLPTNNNTGVFLAPLKALPAMLDRPTYAQQ